MFEPTGSNFTPVRFTFTRCDPVHCLGQSGTPRGPVRQHDLNLSGRKAQDTLENLLGIEVTQSAISQAKLRVTKLGTPLHTAYDDIRTEIQQSAVVHQAELARQVPS